MKIFKLTSIAMITALMVVGCAKDRLVINTNNGNGEISNEGYLVVSGLTADCRIDERDPLFSSSSTRNGAIDVNTFDCRIINEDNEEVMAFKFGERPAEQIALEAGDYLFEIKSGEVPGAAWDTPVYGTVKPFNIVRKQTTTLSEIVCSLMQIKVSITYAPDLLERLGAETTTTAKIGDNELTFSLSESRAAFFLAPQINNSIELSISGSYAADKINFKKINMTKEVKDVKVGQYSKIHFYIEHANEGKINVGVTIRDWVTDEVIPCNVADLVTEKEWGNDDPIMGDEGDPSIVWSGNDISKRYSLDAVSAIDLIINSTKGIKEFIVQIKSDTLTPSELAGVGLCNILNLCYPEKSYDSTNPVYVDTTEALGLFNFKVGSEVLNQNTVPLSITPFVNTLRSVSSPGHRHDFILTVTDNEGSTTVRTLKLQSGEVTEEPAEEPSLEWVGNDINQRVDVVDGLAVDLLVKSTAGIKKFIVKIESETLTPEELKNGAGLCDVLNLVNPAESFSSTDPTTPVDCEAGLRALDFKVCDEVLNQHEVLLSISNFMGVLKSVSGSDLKLHNFVLTIVDNNDNVTTKTLMLRTGNK